MWRHMYGKLPLVGRRIQLEGSNGCFALNTNVSSEIVQLINSKSSDLGAQAKRS